MNDQQCVYWEDAAGKGHMLWASPSHPPDAVLQSLGAARWHVCSARIAADVEACVDRMESQEAVYREAIGLVLRGHYHTELRDVLGTVAAWYGWDAVVLEIAGLPDRQRHPDVLEIHAEFLTRTANKIMAGVMDAWRLLMLDAKQDADAADRNRTTKALLEDAVKTAKKPDSKPAAKPRKISPVVSPADAERICRDMRGPTGQKISPAAATGGTDGRARGNGHAKTPDRGQLRFVPVDSIDPNSFNTRDDVDFTEAELAGMVETIKAHGIQQPLLLRPHPTKPREYELVAGQRRLIAAGSADLAEVPALVREMTDAEAETACVVENLQRKDLSPMAQARAIQQRLSRPGAPTEAELAKQIGMSQPWLSNTKRLLELPPKLAGRVQRGELGRAHAIAVLKYKAFPRLMKIIEEHTEHLAAGRVKDFEARLEQIVRDNTRPMEGVWRGPPAWEEQTIFTPSKQDALSLWQIEIKRADGKGKERRATNLELWDELEKTHIDGLSERVLPAAKADGRGSAGQRPGTIAEDAEPDPVRPASRSRPSAAPDEPDEDAGPGPHAETNGDADGSRPSTLDPRPSRPGPIAKRGEEASGSRPDDSAAFDMELAHIRLVVREAAKAWTDPYEHRELIACTLRDLAIEITRER